MMETTPSDVLESEKAAQEPIAKRIVQRILKQRELGIFLVILAMVIGLNIASENFFRQANIIALVVGMSFDAIVAIGMTVLMVSGGFDLAVGSTLAVAGAVTAYSLTSFGMSTPMAILMGLLAGVVVGVINGMLVTKVNVNPLIATLGMMQVVRGVVLLLTAGYGIPNLPDHFTSIAQGEFLGLQYPVWVMFFFVIIGEILLRRSRYFRQSYFVGGNERSAELSGMRVDHIKVINYIIASAMAAASGILLAARFGSASVSAGQGAELRVISAVVIGGASLAGGEGSVLGSLLGVALMALISNGLNLLGINVYWQTIVIGAVLIIAVAADSLSRRNKTS